MCVMFQNGADGTPAEWTGEDALYFRWGTSFCTLSVRERVELWPCFSGWIETGELFGASELH